MKLKTTFKGIEHTPSLDEKIEQKSQKLKKYFDGNLNVHWTCSTGDHGLQVADIKVHGPHFDYHASGSSDSLYKAFDLAINKIERQVVKKKSKRRNHIHSENASFKEEQIDGIIKDEEFWQDKDDSVA